MPFEQVGKDCTRSNTHRGRDLILDSVLLDTGSGGCIFATDAVLGIGLTYEAEDYVHRIHGVGGAEFVFTKQVDRLTIGSMSLSSFAIEVGAMDYGFPINGIVGMDWLLQAGAILDMGQLSLSYPG